MQNYLSQRQLAALLKTDSVTVAKLATELQLGTAGTHPNSAKTFSPAAVQKIGGIHFANCEGKLRTQKIALDDERLRNARAMGQLWSLAQAMGGACWRELEDLHAVVKKIDAGIILDRNRTDLRTVQGKTQFCAQMTKHGSALAAALNAVSAKI